MVNWAVDVETIGLDGEFRYGHIYMEDGKDWGTKNRDEFWKKIIIEGLKLKRNGKMLNVYAHNHIFDIHKYADLEDTNIVWFSMKPFIAGYRNSQGQEAIKFLDTMAIFRGSLEKIGEALGYPKIEYDKSKFEKKELTEVEWAELITYCKRDTEIVMKFLNRLKEIIKRDGVNLRRLYTMPQIAMGVMLKMISEGQIGTVNIDENGREEDDLFYDRNKGRVHWTRYSDEIQGIYWDKKKREWCFRGTDGGGAYRGAGVRLWKLGETKDVNYVDCNSLYPYSACRISFPNLMSERKLLRPLEVMDINELFDKIGISRCLIYNKSNKIGLLASRTIDRIWYPTEGKYLIGTWTHIELAEAIKEGYEIIDIEWSIMWNKTKNPFERVIKRLYERRGEGEFEKAFYKNVMNNAFGKFAQKRVNEEIKIVDIENVEEYLSKGYEICGGEDYKRIMAKSGNFTFKPYYAPIIPTLINANAKIYMYKFFKKIGKENLIYSDTDSIIFINKGIEENFPISEEMGDFKIVHKGEDIIIKAPKTYKIKDEIKMSGIDISRSEGVDKAFNEGIIKSRKMQTIKSAKSKEEVGKFESEERDLSLIEKEYIERARELENKKIYIDCDIMDYSYFTKKLGEYIKGLEMIKLENG